MNKHVDGGSEGTTKVTAKVTAKATSMVIEQEKTKSTEAKLAAMNTAVNMPIATTIIKFFNDNNINPTI